MLRRLRETTPTEFRILRESSQGIGTPLAEYAETGPYHCQDCIYITKRDGARKLGLCKESHMMKDSKTRKNKKGLAVVNLQRGCCRFVKPGAEKK